MRSPNTVRSWQKGALDTVATSAEKGAHKHTSCHKNQSVTVGTRECATHRAGQVPWRSVLPLIAASAPMAWIGARLTLPAYVYGWTLGGLLIASALALWITAPKARATDDSVLPHVPVLPGLAVGAAIGLVSGITGTGGAIFLTPLLIFLHWAPTRMASGISVAFVLANSLLGLAGLLSKGASLSASLPVWIAAVVVGALIGTQLGIRVLPVGPLRRVLSVVLLIAAGKLILTS